MHRLGKCPFGQWLVTKCEAGDTKMVIIKNRKSINRPVLDTND